MKKSLLTGSVIASVLLLAPVDALACGETLFRVGQGMRYEAHAPLPAVVLLYTSAGSSTADNEGALRKGLEKAGHKVTVMSAGESFVQASGARPYDVVIADLAAIDAITQSISSATAKPSFVPVIGSSVGSDLRDRYPWWVREGASLGKYLAAINKVMEIRAK
ncbi:MAG: hypothetical protein ABIR98_06715 [Usitatibacter sp.]